MLAPLLPPSHTLSPGLCNPRPGCEGWAGFMTSTTASDGAMRGLKGVVFGVANSRSIAWGIAKAARAAGAEIALTFQGDALEKRVRPLAAEIGAHVLGHCDVTEGATIDAVFAGAEKLWSGLDFVVHCV